MALPSLQLEPAASFEVSATISTVSVMGEEGTQALRASSLGYSVFTGEWLVMVMINAVPRVGRFSQVGPSLR